MPAVLVPAACLEIVCRLCKIPVDPLKKGVRLMRKVPFEYQCPSAQQ